ncbi:MAG: GNAT family N-acetyltransferase, partial [Proteobacteria bacterium]|nr:GNAT family N-acetyltransferase [Pseudomonadota bacterium]
LTALYPEDAEDPPAPWTAADLARRKTFLVARSGGSALGCGGVVANADHGAFEIVRMYVRPEARGRGLAGQVLAALEALAAERGAQCLRLRCGPRQPAAVALYERHGYRPRAAFAQHREHPTNLFFEKRLTP